MPPEVDLRAASGAVSVLARASYEIYNDNHYKLRPCRRRVTRVARSSARQRKLRQVKYGTSLVAIYATHRAALVNYANAIVGDSSHAEDIVQEAWLRLDNLMRRRPPDRPVAYLFRIVRNIAIDLRRRQILEKRYFDPDGQILSLQVADDVGTPEAAAVVREELRLFEEAWSDLPERTRIVLEMRRFGGCTLEEIADHLDISVTSVHGIIAKGIAQCRRHLRSRQ